MTFARVVVSQFNNSNIKIVHVLTAEYLKKKTPLTYVLISMYMQSYNDSGELEL